MARPWWIAGFALAAATLAQAGGRGDAERGALAWEARCSGCHSVETDRIGPRHAGVFGRRAGSVSGFDYSPALRQSRLVWDAATLDRWLSNPEALAPGQRMGVRLGDPAIRADVIAYLATLDERASVRAQGDMEHRSGGRFLCPAVRQPAGGCAQHGDVPRRRDTARNRPLGRRRDRL
ncbi:MAG: c-type cytochrome [Sphaerotilus sp.]|nr:c-type cytochrome [Sphaerotilus sp.]MDZ7857912.1 c-type cytochrome [Sphaerotilus sp.]